MPMSAGSARWCCVAPRRPSQANAAIIVITTSPLYHHCHHRHHHHVIVIVIIIKRRSNVSISEQSQPLKLHAKYTRGCTISLCVCVPVCLCACVPVCQHIPIYLEGKCVYRYYMSAHVCVCVCVCVSSRVVPSCCRCAPRTRTCPPQASFGPTPCEILNATLFPATVPMFVPSLSW
jgi:hypothetical protein